MDSVLQQGIATLKAGDRPKALQLLSQSVQENPKSEQAWLWLSAAVNTDEERLYCLDRVLTINPNNELAKRGKMHLLQQKRIPGIYKPQQTEDQLRPPRSLNAYLPSKPYDQPEQQVDLRTSDKLITFGVREKMVKIIMGTILTAVCCIAGLAFIIITPIVPWQSFVTQVASTSILNNTAIPSPTWPPTWTPRPSPTPISDLCTFDHPATKKYLWASTELVDEVGRAIECATQNGAIGPAIAPCIDQLRQVRSNFQVLWYPACATNHQLAYLAFINEAILMLEAAEERDEEALNLHSARFEERTRAAQREADKLAEILKANQQ